MKPFKPCHFAFLMRVTKSICSQMKETSLGLPEPTVEGCLEEYTRIMIAQYHRSNK